MSDSPSPQTSDQAPDAPVISQELLEILACPIDKSPVKLVGDRLVCQEQGHKYRIEDGIPIMLVDEVEQ